MRLLQALKVNISPTLRPLIQVVTAMLLVVSFVITYGGFFAEIPLSHDRKLYLLCASELQGLVNALATYKANCGEYPKELLLVDQGIQGWHGPYVKEVPLDPWGRPFIPEILSYGADGKPGGDLLDTDLSSRYRGRIIADSPSEIRRLWMMRGIWIGAWICFVGCIAVLQRTAHLVRLSGD